MGKQEKSKKKLPAGVCLSGVLLFKILQGRGQEGTRGCFRRWAQGRKSKT